MHRLPVFVQHLVVHHLLLVLFAIFVLTLLLLLVFFLFLALLLALFELFLIVQELPRGRNIFAFVGVRKLSDLSLLKSLEVKEAELDDVYGLVS